MHCLVKLALALVPLASAMPQYPGAVICDDTGVSNVRYKTESSKDVTENYGDKGWVNHDGDICDSNTETCQRLEGSEVTVEIGVSFGAGVEIPVHEALSNGLNFGVSVAWSTTKSRGTQESCPISKDAKPYQNPCVCGMQYKAYRQRATGTQFADNACGEEVNPQDFNVTSAVLVDSGEGDDQTPQVEWRTCRSSKSKCSNIEDMDPCAGDL